MENDIIGKLAQASFIKLSKQAPWYEPSGGVSDPEMATMLYLAEKGEGTRYEVSKEKKIYYSVVHDVFKKLLERGWIRKHRDEKSDRNITKSVYRPTIAGLLYVFLKHPENPNVFKKIEQRFPRAIKWIELFERHGVGVTTAEALISGIVWCLYSFERGRPERRWNLELGALNELIPQLILSSDRGTILKIAQAAAEDKELYRFVLSAMESEREWLSEKVDLVNEILNTLEQSRFPKNRKGGEKSGKGPHR